MRLMHFYGFKKQHHILFGSQSSQTFLQSGVPRLFLWKFTQKNILFGRTKMTVVMQFLTMKYDTQTCCAVCNSNTLSTKHILLFNDSLVLWFSSLMLFFKLLNALTNILQMNENLYYELKFVPRGLIDNNLALLLCNGGLDELTDCFGNHFDEV